MSALQLFPPEQVIRASLQLGGSKSISNRLLILQKVVQQNFSFNNLSDSEDTKLLLQALTDLEKGRNYTFNVHHAGTDLRFLTAFLSTQPGGTYSLSGSTRLKERPIGELVVALRQLGADITYLEKESYPPLLIKGKRLTGSKVHLTAAISSQFISALLLISPLLPKGLQLDFSGEPVSWPYINMTIELLKAFGVNIERMDNSIRVQPKQDQKSGPSFFSIESDWSSASYWFSVCALSSQSQMQIRSFNQESHQADSQLVQLYSALGVRSTFDKDQLTLTHGPSTLREFNHDFTSCPDIAPTLACTCLGLGIKARLTGLKTLQLKESRRIDVLKTELEKFEAKVIAGDDYLELIPPLKKPQGTVRIATHHDHRMAMSFAPLSIVYPGLQIDNKDVVNKSYPRFWDDLQSLGFRLNLQS
jgi:3-phosphoshikimate 1-carboxyvinyltransferase